MLDLLEMENLLAPAQQGEAAIEHLLGASSATWRSPASQRVDIKVNLMVERKMNLMVEKQIASTAVLMEVAQ